MRGIDMKFYASIMGLCLLPVLFSKPLWAVSNDGEDASRVQTDFSKVRDTTGLGVNAAFTQVSYHCDRNAKMAEIQNMIKYGLSPQPASESSSGSQGQGTAGVNK
jgi:hypothetical protein